MAEAAECDHSQRRKREGKRNTKNWHEPDLGARPPSGLFLVCLYSSVPSVARTTLLRIQATRSSLNYKPTAMESNRILISIACLFLFASTAAAIHCHVCNSHHQPDCASSEKVNAFDNFLQDCSKLPDGDKYTYCRKITQDIPASVGGGERHTRIIRQCGFYNTSSTDGCQKAGIIGGGGQFVCHCAEDGCNGASNLHSYLPIATLLAFTAVLAGHNFF